MIEFIDAFAMRRGHFFEFNSVKRRAVRMFSEKMKQMTTPIVKAIYEDAFIQGLVRGDIDADAVRHYLKADARYLNEFAKIYALLIPKVETKEALVFLNEQIAFAASGEVPAHHTLAAYAGESYDDIIAQGDWYPSADHYIKHMYYQAYRYSEAAYTIAAMAPCPHVYARVAQMALAAHHFDDAHPFKVWFEFYATEMDELCHVLDQWVDDVYMSSPADVQHQLERNFLESTIHERRFFNMAYMQECWPFEEDVNHG